MGGFDEGSLCWWSENLRFEIWVIGWMGGSYSEVEVVEK